MNQPMLFEVALPLLRSGRSIARTGWNGKGMYIALQRPNREEENTLQYIYLITVTGDRVPWVASHTDMLAEDWVLIPELTDETKDVVGQKPLTDGHFKA